jgi:hypothetical protein
MLPIRLGPPRLLAYHWLLTRLRAIHVSYIPVHPRSSAFLAMIQLIGAHLELYE